MNTSHNRARGFTLIELLIVIAIIAILASVVFVALNPLKRFQDSRDSKRAADVNGILSAIKVNQIDSGGSYLPKIAALTDGGVYMIGTATSGCNLTCTTPVTSATNCADLTGLVTGGYLGSIPVSPNGTGSWSAGTTGYTISKASTGIVTIRSCENEDTGGIEIQASR